MTLPALLSKDPTELGFPPMLPMELAAHTGTTQSLCESYGITREQWAELRTNPLFTAACQQAVNMVKEEGSSFKMKARTMAEMFLKKTYDLVMSDDPERVPASVQAQLITFTVRMAGLDASVEQKAAAAGKAMTVVPLQINLHLE